MNTITPAYAKVNEVRVAPVSELQDVTGAQIPIQGVGGVWMGPLAYVIICVQIEGVSSYDKDQVFLQ